ncbi:MAG: hypothetical protein NVS4B8_03830 [Herpetosiphon sp.]
MLFCYGVGWRLNKNLYYTNTVVRRLQNVGRLVTTAEMKISLDGNVNVPLGVGYSAERCQMRGIRVRSANIAR